MVLVGNSYSIWYPAGLCHILLIQNKFSFKRWINNSNYSENYTGMFVSTMSLAKVRSKAKKPRDLIPLTCVFWTAITISTQTSMASGYQMVVRVYQNHDCIEYLHTHTHAEFICLQVHRHLVSLQLAHENGAKCILNSFLLLEWTDSLSFIDQDISNWFSFSILQ